MTVGRAGSARVCSGTIVPPGRLSTAAHAGRRPGRAPTEALQPRPSEDDVALHDCPPAIGLLPLMALVAADQALVPVAPGGADARELGGLLAALDRLRASCRASRLASTDVVVTQGGGKTAAIVAMLQH